MKHKNWGIVDRMFFGFWDSYVEIHNVDLDTWCEKYDLRIFEGRCSRCERKLTVNIPFAVKGVRGIKSGRCPCGSNFVPFSFIEIGDGPMGLNRLM